METLAAVQDVQAAAYTIPTEGPESDGTLEWGSTTLVLVTLHANGKSGLGYTYADAAAAAVVQDLLAGHLSGADAMDVPACWSAMTAAVRNNGQSGLSMMAVAAVDAALWDLKAKLLGLPLVKLLGACRTRAQAYGSGGLTSYGESHLQQQLGDWAGSGFKRVKMKVGREPAADLHRVQLARQAAGEEVALMVDANGAYDRKPALEMAERFRLQGVDWFEEPVDHRDLEGLRLLRDHAPPGMEISAGEYGFELAYFQRMLQAGAVDVLQADATRCGITGFLQAAALCEAHRLPMSSHCAPALHVHLGCAARPVRHVEYFHDHVRIEQMLFDGAVTASDGFLEPDLSRPGLGLEFKAADAKRYLAEFL